MFLTANEETYENGQIIFKEGSFGDWIYVIESGKVELSKNIGTRKVVLEILEKGCIFGELGFITKQPRTATARSIGTSIIGIIDNEFLITEYNKLSGNFRTILHTIVTRLNHATEVSAQTKLRRTTGERTPMVLTLTYNTKVDLIKAFSSNAGKNGLFIKTKTPMPAGEKFFLKLKLPEVQEPINVECRVAWNRPDATSPVNPPGMGVEFIKISKTDQEILNKELMRPNPAGKK